MTSENERREQAKHRSTKRMMNSDADECRVLTKEIGPPGDNMLSRFQEDVMSQIRMRLEDVEPPAEVMVTIEVNEIGEP